MQPSTAIKCYTATRAFSHYKLYQRQDFILLEHYQWFLVVIWLDAADEVWLALLKDFH